MSPTLKLSSSLFHFAVRCRVGKYSCTKRSQAFETALSTMRSLRSQSLVFSSGTGGKSLAATGLKKSFGEIGFKSSGWLEKYVKGLEFKIPSTLTTRVLNCSSSKTALVSCPRAALRVFLTTPTIRSTAPLVCGAYGVEKSHVISGVLEWISSFWKSFHNPVISFLPRIKFVP